MSKLKTAMRLLRNNRRFFYKTIFDKLNEGGFLKCVGDRTFLKIAFGLRFGMKLNLRKPKTFNEKIQWLKLNDHRPEYIKMVDKIAAKEYVSERIGADYIIPTLATWKHVEDIEWDKLPEQFVLKWNHDSGSIVICKDKRTFNRGDAVKKLRYGEKFNGFWYGREWPYKGVQPLLLAERYMEDSVTQELRDYKVFTFGGKAKMMLIASGRQKKGEEVKFDYFDVNKSHLNLKNDHPNSVVLPQLPATFDKMIILAEKISSGYPHMRVDFYEVDGKVFFGEITLYHGSGLMSWVPEEWNERMGSWLLLPDNN